MMRRLLTAVLIAACLPTTVRANPEFRFLDRPPDGELPYWTWENHDDSAWMRAPDSAALAETVAKSVKREFFVRFRMRHTPESVNNSWFHIRHSGSVEIFVNGMRRAESSGPALTGCDYHVSPRKVETLGENLYAIHFRHEGEGTPLLDIGWKSSPWTCTDEGTFRPPALVPNAIRDAQVCRGGDGAWYLTGTTGDDAFLLPGPDCWLRNPGIEVFRSTDLKEWKSLGHVWTFDRDGTWNREFGTFGGRGPARAVFAPEIHFLKGSWWLVYSVNSTTKGRNFGIGLARGESPSGPWHEMNPSGPITQGFDPSLFEDDDGTVYLLKHGGEIARMKPDMTGIEGGFTHPAPSNFPRVGYEGVSLFKHGGRYHLAAAEWNLHADGAQSYDCMIASADSPLGPYGPRSCVLRFGGHNGFFQDASGNLLATVWSYPDGDPHWQKVSILELRLDPRNTFTVVRH